jgi:lipopolysaccharide cholinephosphotransferase
MTDIELKELQQVILEIALDFNIFCLENNITYYLMGGSALGAMRHKGFIPWDDDFDVFMDSDNYFKFLKIAKNKLNTDKYYFQEENTQEWPLFFSKVRMNNTTFIEKDVITRRMHHGIYIDVMCLNYAFENKFLRRMQYLSARILSSSALSKKGYITNSKIKKILLLASRVLTTGPLKNILLSFVRINNSNKTSLVGHFFGRAPFPKTTFPVDFLSEPRYTSFEDVSFPVPQEVERYLVVRYGNKYMELPSKEEMAKYPSHAHIVDVKESYKKYIYDES